jgi:galactokinase
MARVLAEAGLVPGQGFELATSSDLPAGAGLSSSAALLAASALALLAAADADPPDRAALARLCQRAEVEFVGVPCGLMDPYAVLCTRAGAALLLDCASGATRPVPLPDGLEVLICDTGVARELRSGKYAERRAQCERALARARVELGRSLASLSELELGEIPRLERALPDLELRRARHVVSENARVRAFAAALEREDRASAGAALFASHDSLRADYEVTCPESDALVEDSRGVDGCLGARMTGAGFGGCTLHLVEAGRAPDVAARLGARFRARFGRTPPAFATRAAAPAALEMG